jgi:hypothetical protein
MSAAQVPLVELLLSCPKKAQYKQDGGTFATSYWAVGAMCHEAAAEIDRLETEVARLTAELQEVRKAAPAGWKLVPVEPTREMMEAMPRMPPLRAEGLPFRAEGWSLNAITNLERWAAAIKAAPDAPASTALAQWIDVSERKPEKFQEVLIAFAGQCSIASTGQYTDSPHDHGGWCYPAENHGANDAGEGWPTVTHWMPLSEVPKAPKP